MAARPLGRRCRPAQPDTSADGCRPVHSPATSTRGRSSRSTSPAPGPGLPGRRANGHLDGGTVKR